jgi:HEPN domain-containing protein
LNAFSILEEARRTLSKAFEELREGVKSGNVLRIRDVEAVVDLAEKVLKMCSA